MTDQIKTPIRQRQRVKPKKTKGLIINEGHFGGDVGYGNPPKSTQFQKGQSGNSKGRTKGSKSFGGMVQSSMNAEISVLENGQRVVRTTAEIALKQLANNAAKGDLKSAALFFSLIAKHGEAIVKDFVEGNFSEDEQAILAKMSKKYEIEVDTDTETDTETKGDDCD